MAGNLQGREQLPFLRQSLETDLKGADYGIQELPTELPISGAIVDLAYLQNEKQKGTSLVNTIAPQHRLIPAIAVTVADEELRTANLEEGMRLLDLADAHRKVALEKFSHSPFLKLNLVLNELIANTVCRKTGDASEVDAFIAELEAEATINEGKKLEWIGHAYALLACIKGAGSDLDKAMENFESLIQLRPTMVSVLSIEPTCKEILKKFELEKGSQMRRLMGIVEKA